MMAQAVLGCVPVPDKPASLSLHSGGELWQHIGDHYSEAYAAKIMRDVLRTIAQVTHVFHHRTAFAYCVAML